MQINKHFEADSQVLNFIEDFYALHTPEDKMEEYDEYLRKKFMAGYCWHFAHILKATFNRGQVCWTAPYGHFVWVDIDKTPYDIEGVYFGEAKYFIPESFLGNAIDDFKHIRERIFNAMEEDIQKIIEEYEKSIDFS